MTTYIYTFTLDWYVRLVEFDPHAPKPQDGEPVPMRVRYLNHAVRRMASSLGEIRTMHEWHLTHDGWLPAGAVRDDPALMPNVSEIQRVEQRVK